MHIEKSAHIISKVTGQAGKVFLLVFCLFCHAIGAQAQPATSVSQSEAQVLFEQAEELSTKAYPSKDDIEKMRELYMQSALAGYVPAMEMLLHGESPSLRFTAQASIEPEVIEAAIRATQVETKQAGVKLKENDPERVKILSLYAQAAQLGNRTALSYFFLEAYNALIHDQRSNNTARIEKHAQLASAGYHYAASILETLYASGNCSGLTAEPNLIEAFQWQLLYCYVKGTSTSSQLARSMAQLSNQEIETAQQAAAEIIRKHNPPRRNVDPSLLEKAPDCMKALYVLANELPQPALADPSVLTLPQTVLVADAPVPEWIAPLFVNDINTPETADNTAIEPTNTIPETSKTPTTSTAIPLTKTDAQFTETFAQIMEEVNAKQYLNREDVEKLQPQLRQLALAGYIPAIEILLSGNPSTTLRYQLESFKERFPDGLQQPSSPQSLRPLRLSSTDSDRDRLRALYARAARYGNAAAVEYFAGEIHVREVSTQNPNTTNSERIEKCIELASLGSASACYALASLYQNGEYQKMQATPDPLLAFQWQLLNSYISGGPFTQTVSYGRPGSTPFAESPADMMAKLSAREVEQAQQNVEKIILAHNPPRRDAWNPSPSDIDNEPACMKALYAVAAKLDKPIYGGPVAELTIEPPLSEAQLPDWLASLLKGTESTTQTVESKPGNTPATTTTTAGMESPRGGLQKHELHQQYDTLVTTATQTRDETLAKIEATYQANIEAAKAEVRKTFEPLFRNAKPEEARSFTRKMEAIIGGNTAAASGAGTSNQISGKWVSRDLNSYSSGNYYWLFDFSSGKGMTLIHTYTPSSERSKTTTRTEYNVKTEDGKIVITPVSPTNYIWLPGISISSSSDTYQHSFEIQTPFDPNRLVMTFSCTGNTMTIQLEKESQ